jgi:hypothetical protein
MSFLDTLLSAIRRVASGGTLQTPRPTINFIGATVADNPTTNQTDVTVGSVITSLNGDVSASGSGAVPATITQSAQLQITGTLNFVRDCGADPSGVADCGPALTAAGAILTALAAGNKLPSKTLRLFVPPGRYSVTTNPTPMNFNGKGTAVEVYGVRDASIFECANTDSIINISNIPEAHIHDLTFVGTQAYPNPDTVVAVAVSCTHETIYERLHFDWLLCSNAVIRDTGAYRMRDCLFTGCGTLDANKAVVWGNGTSLDDLENVKFIDTPLLNGYGNPASKCAFANLVWYRHDDSSALAGGGYNYLIKLKACWFDESVQRQVWVKGGPTTNIGRVSIDGCYVNPPALAGATSSVRLENVDHADVNGLTNSGFNTAVAAATLELVSVAYARLRSIITNPSASSNFITADSGCTSVYVDDSVLTADNIQSSASRTVVTNNGVTSDLGVASATVVAKALLTRTVTAGVANVAHVPATGRVADVIGIALDAANSTHTTRIARVGQRVAVLSDGAGVIAVGDYIINSTATAGRVAKGTATKATIGIAMTGATNVADTAFDILYLPTDTTGDTWLDTGGVQRASIDLTHGVGVFGNGGSDFYGALGPATSAETLGASLWLLGHNTARSTSNYAVQGDGTISYWNAPTTAHVWNIANVAMAAMSTTTAYWGAGIAAATPVLLDWTTSTTPAFHSGTAATSLTVGTNKAAASLVLQQDAAITAWTLSGGNALVMQAPTAATSVTINQAAAAGAAATMAITAQAAGGTNDGAPLALGGGAHSGASTADGSVKVTTPLNAGYYAATLAGGTTVLTNAQSNANIFVLTSTGGAAYQATLSREYADTSLIFVRNNSAGTLTVAYLGATSTVTVATNTSALICSDGSILQKVMTAS